MADARGHEEGAQHAGADLVGDQGQVLVQRLGQAHHGVLADVVDAHVGRRQQPGHAGRVDDVALEGRIGLGRLQHHGREQPHAVDHAPEVDAQHPLPIFQRVLPDQPARAHACVVEHEVRRAELLAHLVGQGLHLGCVGHIHAACQHTHALPFELGGSLVQRLLLHIDQHQVHAQLRANARALQAEARARARQHGRLALEVLDHSLVSLSCPDVLVEGFGN